MRHPILGTAFVCLCLSLIFSWLLGYLLVVESDRSLLFKKELLSESRYPFVPGPEMEMEFRSGKAALAAALPYAATLGVGLPALLLPLTLLIRRRNFGGKYVPALSVSALMLLGFNLEGFRPWESLYALGTGGWLALWISGRCNPQSDFGPDRTAIFGITGAALLIVFVCCGTGIRDFKALRDAVLLSNAPGTTLCDLYYHYTLAAAEPLKPPWEKTQPIALLQTKGFTGPMMDIVLRQAEAEGVIPLKTSESEVPPGVDWVVSTQGGELMIRRAHGWSGRHFLFPAPSIKDRRLFSDEKSLTSWLGLRSWLKLSVTVGLPTAILWLLSFMLRRFVGRTTRWAGAKSPTPGDFLLIISGLGAAVLFYLNPFPTDPAELLRRAESQEGWARVRALRALAEQNSEPLSGDFLIRFLTSHDPRLRYWAAIAVIGGGGPDLRKALIENLDSPQVHVAAASASALARFKEPPFVALASAFHSQARWYLRETIYRIFRKHDGKPPLLFLSPSQDDST